MSKNPTATEKGRVEQSEVLEEVTLKLAKVNREWEKYNLFSGRIVIHDREGYKLSNNLMVFRDLPTKESPTISPIQVLGSDYRLFANEEVVKVCDEWAETNSFKPFNGYTHMSKSGNAIFRAYLPKDDSIGSFTFTNGDKVRVGFCVRNSIDGTVGFGLDAFTYRGLTDTGVIVSRASQTTTYHKHTSGLSGIVANMQTYVDETVKAGELVVNYYKKLETLPLTMDYAKALAKTPIPKKYHPFNFDDDKLPILPTQTMTMLEVYNHETDSIWHSDKTDIRSKYLYFNHLHSALINVIPMVVAI